MKRCVSVLAAAVAALFLIVINSCGTVEADIGGSDTYEEPSEDIYSPPPPPVGNDTEESSDTSLPTPSAAVDNDGDGVVAGNGPNQDCNDSNALIHPYATETCANGLDDDCDGVIDEGCVVPPTGTPATADTDKDGYPDGPQDCAPNNANIHPGAVEVCNSVDDDCDGVVDEQCGVTPPPVSGTTATFTVTYPDNQPRTLNVQVYDHKSDLGGWWDKSASDSDKDVTLTFADVPDGICGFRFNVSEGNPASWWLCYGNGSTAQLDPDAGVVIVYKGVTYTKGSLKTWSAQGGTNAGCSALLQTNSASDCSP